MHNMRPFQIALLASFGLLGLLSLVVLASFKGFSIGHVNPYGEEVIIWGTLDEDVILETIERIADVDKDFKVVTYYQKDPRNFETELVDSIAERRSPNAIILSHEDLVKLRTKLQPIPYEAVSERVIKDTYIDGSEIFARTDGLYALPFLVDPLVMYWNRDLFSSAGMASPPATWEALSETAQQVTLRDATRNILLSTVAFGEYRNVLRAKAVLLMLLIQSGSRMIEEQKEGYAVLVDTPIVEDNRKPLNAALQFFVEFSNANSPLYSWNRTKQDDLTAFLSEELTLYFGFGSEESDIKSKNPNLNLDMVTVPQGAGATIKRGYGKFYGLSLVRGADNLDGAYQAILKLGSAEPTLAISLGLNMAPTHRASIGGGASSASRQTIFNQALIARGWLDPDSAKSSEIFQQMVEDVVSNRQKVSAAVSDTVRRLELAF